MILQPVHETHYTIRALDEGVVVGENTTCRKFRFDKHSSEVYIKQLG